MAEDTLGGPSLNRIGLLRGIGGSGPPGTDLTVTPGDVPQEFFEDLGLK